MKRLKNLAASAALLAALLVAGLFTGCGPQCPEGEHMNMLGKCVSGDTPQPVLCLANQHVDTATDTCVCDQGFVPVEDGEGCKYPDETCDMDPDNEDQILIGALSDCGSGDLYCTTISYRSDGGQPQVVAHDINGQFMLEMVSCGYYRLEITCPYGDGTGRKFVWRVEGLAEQFDEGVTYRIKPPDGNCNPMPDPPAGTDDDDDTTDEGGGTDVPAPLFTDLAACLAYTPNPLVSDTLDMLFCCNVQDFGLIPACAGFVAQNP